MGQATARVAGALRTRDRLDSRHTIDAFVIATSVRLGGGIVATADPDDLRSLARDHPNVSVESISGTSASHNLLVAGCTGILLGPISNLEETRCPTTLWCL